MRPLFLDRDTTIVAAHWKSRRTEHPTCKTKAQTVIVRTMDDDKPWGGLGGV
jgi:hypothetical protein